MVICLEQGADLHMAQLMPLPLTVSCFSKIKIGFTFLLLAHTGSPGQRAVKQVCVCACVRACVYYLFQSRVPMYYENLYFTRMNISRSKTNGNNKLTNLTVNINSQHIQHDELCRARQSLAIECHTIHLPQFRDCMTYSAFRCTIS